MTGDLSNTGPMARTALDAALMMNVIARPDARDAYALPEDDTDYTKKLDKKLKGLKVGFALRFGDHPLDIEVAVDGDQGGAPVRGAGLHGRGGGGAVLVRRGEPRLRHPLADGAAAPAAALPRGAPRASSIPSLLAGAKAGLRYSLQDVVNAQVTRRDLAIAWNLFFEKYDLLITPTVAVQPFEAGQNLPVGPDGKGNVMWSPYTPQFNLTRHPAATVPCGLSRLGLPVGLQIVSAHYKDALVLRAAAAYAQTQPLKFPVLPETER